MRHTGSIESERIQKLLRCLHNHELMGERPTTIELQKVTNSCNISADIADARKLGIDIRCRFLRTQNGRRISEFYIERQTEIELA